MSILIKPIITEKNTIDSDSYNRYAFRVDRNANKIQISKAVEDFYGVTVDRVNTMICNRKRKIKYTKAGVVEGRTTLYKKAIITLVKGDTIDLYSDI